jgi:hypothetical protein
LLTGLVIGAVLGVLYAWVVQPVEYTDTKPVSLRADFKDSYRALIAAAYMANGDLVRARARLVLLGDKDIYRTLAEQAQRTLAGASASLSGGSGMQEARALGVLAVALGQPPSTLAATGGVATGAPAADLTPSVTATITPTLQLTPILSATPAVSAGQTGTPEAGRPAASPTPTITLLPTRTFTPTPGSLFALKSEELNCDSILKTPLIVVQAYDAAGQGVPGLQVVVSWEGGESRFFTGLKPELGLGYADFSMDPGVVYTLRLEEGGQIVPNLTGTECESEGGERYWGSWVLIFEQP